MGSGSSVLCFTGTSFSKLEGPGQQVLRANCNDISVIGKAAALQPQRQTRPACVADLVFLGAIHGCAYQRAALRIVILGVAETIPTRPSERL